jgi:dihydropyrimidinase
MSGVAAATRAAALGGTTTVLSFTNPEPGEGALEALRRRIGELGRAGAAVDVGLHAMLYRPDEVVPDELLSLKREGCSGWKLFLAYPELGIMWSARGLAELMGEAARLSQVVQVHCEVGGLIEALLEEALSSGGRGPALFASTRPPAAEAAAVALVLATASATGATCYVTHLSSRAALEETRLWGERGTAGFFAEVCLHHLFFDESVYGEREAERYLVAPPLRRLEDVEALWGALSDGTLDTVGSDHSQSKSETVGELSPDGTGYSYGIAGIGPRYPLLISAGLGRGIPVERLVDLASAGPAAAFGHYPRKGAVAPGSDADMVIFDPAGETTLAAVAFEDGTGDCIYEGMPLRGRIAKVLLGGRVVVEDGRYVDGEATGRFVSPQ